MRVLLFYSLTLRGSSVQEKIHDLGRKTICLTEVRITHRNRIH
jgi:hypothetical protein